MCIFVLVVSFITISYIQHFATVFKTVSSLRVAFPLISFCLDLCSESLRAPSSFVTHKRSLHRCAKMNVSEYEDEEIPEVSIPMSIKSELFRLASALGLDNDEMSSEGDCLDVIDRSVRSIERLKSERKMATSSSGTDVLKVESDTKQEKKLAAKAKTLEDDLRISLKSFDDVGSLKSKVSHLAGQIRKEREQRTVLEKFIETQNKKIMLLITHVDKLMKALKRESGKTIRSLEVNRLLERDAFALNTKIEKQTKVIAVQNR